MRLPSFREAGEPGLVLDGMADIGMINRQRGRWSQWVDFQPEDMHVQKQRGKWFVQPDTFMLRGTIPTPQDYADAEVR